MDPLLIKREFPALVATDVAYLDSASTTAAPRHVIDVVTQAAAAGPGSPERGSHPWSGQAGAAVEAARERLARFIRAAHPDEVVFTAGATAGLNAVTLAWGLPNLRHGDQILYCPADHASAVLPWRRLAAELARQGTVIDLVPYRRTDSGEVDVADLVRLVVPRTRLVTLTHVHNLFGASCDIAGVRSRLPGHIRISVDASQTAGHRPLDVAALGADFVAFGAHKMFGLAGTGVLYCARRVHDELGPFLPGGGTATAGEVATGIPGLRSMPHLMEGGTPGTVGILALAAATDVLDDIGTDAIAAHCAGLTARLGQRFRDCPRIDLLPGPARSGAVGHGIVAFRMIGVGARDLGFALAAHGCYVRAGGHCLPGAPEHDDSVRASVHAYTTDDDIDRLADLVGVIARGGL